MGVVACTVPRNDLRWPRQTTTSDPIILPGHARYRVRVDNIQALDAILSIPGVEGTLAAFRDVLNLLARSEEAAHVTRVTVPSPAADFSWDIFALGIAANLSAHPPDHDSLQVQVDAIQALDTHLPIPAQSSGMIR